MKTSTHVDINQKQFTRRLLVSFICLTKYNSYFIMEKHAVADSLFLSLFCFVFVQFNCKVEAMSLKGVTDSSDEEFIYTRKEENSNSDTNDDTVDDSDVKGTIPTEIKARVTHSTMYAERYLLESNVEASDSSIAYELSKPMYIEIDVKGGKLHKWIPKYKESFQLLPHVAVYDVRKGLFLVGNKKKSSLVFLSRIVTILSLHIVLYLRICTKEY